MNSKYFLIPLLIFISCMGYLFIYGLDSYYIEEKEIKKCEIEMRGNNSSDYLMVYNQYLQEKVWQPNDSWIFQKLSSISFVKYIQLSQDYYNQFYYYNYIKTLNCGKAKLEGEDLIDGDYSNPCILPKKGNEALVYLSFIYQYYEQLPNHVFFIHGHEDSWHGSNFSNVLTKTIDHLSKKKIDYLNLNWERVCSDPVADASNKYPWSGDAMRILTESWKKNSIFEHYFGQIPKELKYRCCAQFIVSKERILQRSKKFYLEMITWLTGTKLTNYDSGRLFEYTWHIIFGENSTMGCQNLEDFPSKKDLLFF